MAYFIFVFSVISDWFSCFSFTEGVRRLLLLIFKDELPLRTCLDFVIEFWNRRGKRKSNSVQYLQNLIVNLVLILLIFLLLYLFNSIQPCPFQSIHKKWGSPKMWNLKMESRIWIMKTELEMESRIKQDCSSKG